MGNLIGQKFNRLTVIEKANSINNKPYWICKCDCGNKTIVSENNLKKKNTKSCGCLKHERIVESATTHGMSNTRIYHIWDNMKQRCYNNKNNIYKYYGKIGIKICDEWKNDFMSFYKWSKLNGYSDCLTLDRIDVNGDYEPNNCRWTNMKVQANNKHSTLYITYRNETKPLKYWSAQLGINYHTLFDRIFTLGMTVDEAFNKSVGFKIFKITFKGKAQSLSKWAKDLDIPYTTLQRRINKYGWTIEKAFTTPPLKRKGKKI